MEHETYSISMCPHKMYVKITMLSFIQREQLRDHEAMVQKLESELEVHRKHPPERGAKQLSLYNFREKDNYLQYEVSKN